MFLLLRKCKQLHVSINIQLQLLEMLDALLKRVFIYFFNKIYVYKVYTY